MKITDFINTFKGTEYKDKLIQKHVVNPYMHWLLKVGEAENIVQKSSYDQDGKFRLNSPLRYYLYMITVVKNYTDLEFGDGEMMRDFNLLEENGVNDMLLALIDDVKRFDTVLKMTLNDHFENYRSLPSYFDSKGAALMEVMDAMNINVSENDSVIENDHSV